MEEKIICSMNGVGIYGVISICIFVGFFTGMLIWAFTKKAAYLNKMGNLPLDSGEKNPDSHPGVPTDSAHWMSTGIQRVARNQAAMTLDAAFPLASHEQDQSLGIFTTLAVHALEFTHHLAQKLGVVPVYKTFRCANCRGKNCCRKKSKH
jgi:hypothetical protein